MTRDRDEHIILKWVGRWVLHEHPASYPNREEAEREAADIDCSTRVLRVEDIAKEM